MLSGNARASADTPCTGRRVLVVEDEYLIGLSLTDCLERAGAAVVWVQNDRDAYAALSGSEANFDTLILDIDLGAGTTGFDIARFARRRSPKAAIIFSSGNPSAWAD